MKKLALLCIAALGSALLVLGTAPGASAYPEVECNVTLDRQVVHPGETFTVRGEASATDNSKIHWTFTFNGTTQERTGSPVEATFTAPRVSTTTHFTLTARADGTQGSCVHSFDITVLGPQVSVSPPGGGTSGGPHGGGGTLPSTGGPMFWLLVAALVLLLAGGGTVVATRKRR